MTKRKRNIIVSEGALVVYVVSYAVLSLCGGYRLVMSGQARPTGSAFSDTFAWQPRFGMCYPFHTATGEESHHMDGLGLLYFPLIRLDQAFVHQESTVSKNLVRNRGYSVVLCGIQRDGSLVRNDLKGISGCGGMEGMRRARMKVPGDREVGFYHCMSRVVDGQFIFKEAQKEWFVTFLREYEAFCEVKVLTFCVMSNHFHVLVEVPKPPEVKPSAEVIIKKLRKLTGCQDPGAAEQELETLRKVKDEAGERRWLERYWARMWDVSAFMKLLKQRFTQWYNHEAGRRGTLWEDRFKSVLVDGAGEALVTMAAYIDLNPVRAGLVSDPKEYRWSGYGEAVAGRKRARAGVQRVVTAMMLGREEPVGRSLELYRMRVYYQGHEENEAVLEDGRKSRGALPHEEVIKVLDAKGRLPMHDYLRCRVRYFCDGAVFGSREFVDGIFNAHRDRFGPKRETGARRLRGVEAELFALRDLRVNVFG